MSERQSQRTLIYVTNGLALTPSDAHEGTVTIGLSATNPTVNSVLSWNGTQFVWTTISSISTLSWTITGNQTGLTGTKSGSYNLVTTGDITCDTLNYNTINPALVPYVGATADVDLGIHNLTTLGNLTCNTLNYTTLNPEVWRLNGQAITAKRTLGSTDNFDIGFITNNTERLTILKDGKVGVNITSPVSLLTLQCDASFTIGLVAQGSIDNTYLMEGHTNGLASGNCIIDMQDDTFVNRGNSGQFIFGMSGTNGWGGGPIGSRVAIICSLRSGAGTTRSIWMYANDSVPSAPQIFLQANTGRVGIGNISPTAYLHIKAGTATASTSPLKLTSGTNLTAPEAGAFEYDGTRLYFTPVAARETIAFLSDLTSGYVPYTGAIANVDLGLFSLTANSLLVQNDFSITSVADNVFIDQLTSDKDLTIRYNDGGVTKTAFFIDASAAQIALAGTTIAAGYEVQVNGDFNVVGQGLVSSSTFPPFRANRTGQVLDLPFSAFSCISTKASDAGDGFGSGFVVEFTDTGGTFTLGQFAFARDGGDRKGRFVVQSNNGTVGDAYSWNFQVRPDGTTYIGNAALNTLPSACTRIDPDGTLHVVTDIGMTVGTGGDFQISLSSDNVLIDNVTSNKNITIRVNKGGATTDLLLFNGTAGSMVVNDSVPLNFRDSAIGIYSQADTFLDLFADGLVRIGNSSAGAPTTYVAIEPDGGTYFVGEGSGLAFAEIYVKDSAASISLDADNPDVIVTQFTTNGQSNNCTPDVANDKITITKAGKYLVNVSAVASIDAGATTLIKISCYLNGVEQNNLHCHQNVVTSNPETHLSVCGIIDVTTVPWDLDLRANVSDTSARNVVFSDINMNVHQLGGT